VEFIFHLCRSDCDFSSIPNAFDSIQPIEHRIFLSMLIVLTIIALPSLFWVFTCVIIFFRRAAKYKKLLKEIDQNKNDIDQLKSSIFQLINLVSQGNIFIAQSAFLFDGKIYVNFKSNQSQFDVGSEFIMVDKRDEYIYGIFNLVQNNAEECVLQGKDKPDPLLLGYLKNGNKITFPPGIVVIRSRTERNYGRQKN
jgi:hypothetical protein